MDRLVVVPPPHEEEGPKEPTPTPVEVLHELHSYIQTLAESGLSLDVTTLTPDMVEQVLMTDARMCELCGSTSETVCPQSGKPHRRHLVVVAQQVLRCLGRAVGRLVARPARVAERMGGSGRVRTERRIVVNPQLFLLSFYFATLPADDVDPLTGECAKHLVEVLQQVKDYGARTEVDETYATALLKSLRRAWLQYQRRAGPQAAPTEPSRQREATEELLRGTREAIVAAAQQLRRSNPPDSSLQQFIALLMERLSRIASEEVIKEVEEELHSIAEQPHEESLLRSPDIQSSKPPQLLSDTNTSGSELDLPPQSPPRERLGPDLPPNWEVDETGRSRPSAGQKEREEREKFLLQEFKARKAYEAAMQVTSPASAEEKLKKELSAAIGEAQLLELARRLNLPSPDLEMIPYMLKVVEESFVEALPQRIRPRAQQEFRDVLDWSIVRRSVKGDAANISNVLMFVVGKIIDYGAPAREAELREKSAEVSTALTNAAPDVGTAVANAFRFLMESIRQLRADVAQYTLSLISAELKANAVNYIRGFVKSCMPITAKWTSSIAFLQRFMAEPRVKDWAESAQAQSTTSLTVEERYIRGALAYGSLFLIKSGNESSTSRWSTLPGELFYFEKPTLFQCANSVQECTLLLLLEGTVSSMLNAKGQSRASIADLLKRLHTLILTLLGGDVKLEELKHLVVDFLNNALSDSSTAAKPTPVLLSEAESKAVSATIDKMVDTNSPLYISFEKKVLAYFEGIVTTKEAPNLAPLGLVTDTLQKQAGLLKTTLQFHWEVYRPFYTELIPILAIPASG